MKGNGKGNHQVMFIEFHFNLTEFVLKLQRDSLYSNKRSVVVMPRNIKEKNLIYN